MNLVGLPQSMPVPVAQSGLANLGKDQLVDPQGNAVSNMVPGEGYWYIRKETGCKAWVEVLPYASDMFPGEGTLPAITDIKIQTADNRLQTADGSRQTTQIRLSISLDNSCKKIDIYYKDQAAADALVLDKGWLIAETDLQVTGKSELEWTDTSSSLQSSSRYYLVGNADVDSDKDGVPDCRQKFVMGKSPVSGPRPPASGNSTTDLRPLASSTAPVRSSVSGLGGGASLGRIIYVDRNNGGDHLTGKAAVVVGADGPKKTVKAGLLEAGNDGSTMIIKSGVYGESLHVAGKNVHIVIQGNVRL